MNDWGSEGWLGQEAMDRLAVENLIEQTGTEAQLAEMERNIQRAERRVERWGLALVLLLLFQAIVQAGLGEPWVALGWWMASWLGYALLRLRRAVMDHRRAMRKFIGEHRPRSIAEVDLLLKLMDVERGIIKADGRRNWFS